MTPTAAADRLARFLAKDGSDIVFRRYAGSGDARAIQAERTVRARVTGTSPGEKKIICGVVEIGDLLPLKEQSGNDVFVIDGREQQLKSIDANTRKIDDVLIGLNLVVDGK